MALLGLGIIYGLIIDLALRIDSNIGFALRIYLVLGSGPNSLFWPGPRVWMLRNVDTDRCILYPGRAWAKTVVAINSDPPKRSSASAVLVHGALGGRVGAIESRCEVVLNSTPLNKPFITVGPISRAYPPSPLPSTPNNATSPTSTGHPPLPSRCGSNFWQLSLQNAMVRLIPLPSQS